MTLWLAVNKLGKRGDNFSFQPRENGGTKWPC